MTSSPVPVSLMFLLQRSQVVFGEVEVNPVDVIGYLDVYTWRKKAALNGTTQHQQAASLAVINEI